VLKRKKMSLPPFLSTFCKSLCLTLCCWIIASLILVIVMCRIPPKNAYKTFAKRNNNHPLLVAHRGFAANYPHDTLFSFHNAHSLPGVDVLEMDVRLTSDLQVVVVHDSNMLRTTGIDIHVEETSLAKLREMDFGARFGWKTRKVFTPNVQKDSEEIFPYRGIGITISTLDEVISAFPSTTLFNIELKHDGWDIFLPNFILADKVCQVLTKNHARHRTIVASGSDVSWYYFSQISDCKGEVPVAPGPLVLLPLVLWSWTFGLIPNLVAPQQIRPYSVVEPPYVLANTLSESCKRAHLPLHVWTVLPQDYDWIAPLVDGIMTDHAELIFKNTNNSWIYPALPITDKMDNNACKNPSWRSVLRCDVGCSKILGL
jgi:glycerophosphoryl diester phosphodiesterase